MAVTKKRGPRAKTDLGADLGLSHDDLVEMYRLVALARAVDERMWILNRAGRIPFVISGQGHEGAQVGIAWALEKGVDWIAPFYRSIATCLTFGMTARDIMTAQYATASDPSSGGRQMPGHYGSHEHNLVSVSSPARGGATSRYISRRSSWLRPRSAPRSVFALGARFFVTAIALFQPPREPLGRAAGYAAVSARS